MIIKGKKVLVTGAGGFIGSHLVERLVGDGAEVKTIIRYNSRNDWGMLEILPPEVRKNLEVITGDIIDPGVVRRAVKDCDVIFHLAALIGIPYSYVAPESYVNTNIRGTLNVMEAGREESVEKIVHTSTSEVYGTATYVPIDEKHPLQGQSPYSASKIGADMLAHSYFLSFNTPVDYNTSFQHVWPPAVRTGSNTDDNITGIVLTGNYSGIAYTSPGSDVCKRYRGRVYPGRGIGEIHRRNH